MSEGVKIGGASSKGWAESVPHGVIGLTDLPNIGGQLPPRPNGPPVPPLLKSVSGKQFSDQHWKDLKIDQP